VNFQLQKTIRSGNIRNSSFFLKLSIKNIKITLLRSSGINERLKIGSFNMKLTGIPSFDINFGIMVIHV